MVNDMIGVWDMVHDDWRGALTIKPSDQRLIGNDDVCTYTSWVIEGSYVQEGSTVSSSMHGTFGGEDTNSRISSPCKQTGHLISFTINFPNAKPQQFTGYLFTHNKRTMAGYTWWEGIPFGWYATKRS